MEHELRHLLLHFRLFGICVFDERQDNGKSHCTRVQNIVIRSYPWALVAMLCCYFWFGTHLQSYENGFVLSWMVSTIILVTQLLTHILIIGEAIAKQSAHRDFFRCLNDIELHLRLCLRMRVQRQQLVKRLMHMFYILLAISTCSLLAFLVALQITGEGIHHYFAFISSLTMRSRLLQLWLYARIVSAYIDCLNQKLLQVLNRRSERLLDVCAEQLHSLDRIEVLAAIRETLQLLHQAVQHVNDFSGWSVCAIVACYTLDYTCHIYWWLLTLDDMLPSFTYLTSISTLLPLGITVCKYCAACNECQVKSRRFIQLWQRLLLLRGGGKRLAAKVYRNYVGDFLLQLQHQPFDFSAKQFFNINLQLLMCILVSISTYLIILIQFLENNVSA